MFEYRVSELTQQKLASIGAAGHVWKQSLPGLLSILGRKWAFVPIKSLTGGTEAFLARVQLNDGTDAVLKIAIPELRGNTVFEKEAGILTHMKGQGYPKLYAYDKENRAMLMEALGQPLRAYNYTVEQELGIICGLLRKSWKMEKVPNADLMRGEALYFFFRDLILALSRKQGEFCNETTVNIAMKLCHARIFDANEACVLTHGDAHSLNVLNDTKGGRNSFKLIDPDGVYSEPAYDLGVLMREWTEELFPNPLEKGQVRVELLSFLTGVPQDGIWAWGLIQCVSTGLLLIDIGAVRLGQKMLCAADAWAETAIGFIK